MNNYINYPKNYNFVQNKAINTDNYKWQPLYNPYEGLIRGNMSRELYSPYKNEKPYEINPANEQASMLTDIDSLCFALIDLNLYLDVHPEDKNKIELFNQYRIEQNELIRQYENRFGPLLLSSDSLNTYPWAWNNKPWPWEN